MKNLEQTYKELLEFLSLTTNENGALGVDIADLTFPAMSGENSISVMADEHLEAMESGNFNMTHLEEDLTYFFPFAEDHSRGKSNAITAISVAIRIKANIKAYAIMTALLELCIDTKKHKKIKPSAKGLLTEVGKVDDKTFKVLDKIMQTSDFVTQGLMLTTSLVYNAKVGNISYPRVASINSEFRNDLTASEVKKVLGVNVSRKMDQQALLGLFLFVFSDFNTQETIHFPIDSNDAPNLQAMVKLSQYLDRRFHELAIVYEDFLDVGLFDLLTQNVDLDLDSIAHHSRAFKQYAIADNVGIPRKEKGKRAAVSESHITKREESREVSTRPSVARKEKEMEKTSSLSDRLGGGRGNRPKSASSRRGNTAEKVWVVDIDFPGGGYFADPLDVADGIVPELPTSRNAGRSSSRRDSGRSSSRNSRSRDDRGSRSSSRRSTRDEPLVSLEIGRDIVDVYKEDVRGEGDDAYIMHNGNQIYLWDDASIDIEELIDEAEGRGRASGRDSRRSSSRRDSGRGSRSSSSRGARGSSRSSSRDSRRGRASGRDKTYTVNFDGETWEYTDADVREDNQGEYIVIDGEKVDV